MWHLASLRYIQWHLCPGMSCWSVCLFHGTTVSVSDFRTKLSRTCLGQECAYMHVGERESVLHLKEVDTCSELLLSLYTLLVAAMLAGWSTSDTRHTLRSLHFSNLDCTSHRYLIPLNFGNHLIASSIDFWKLKRHWREIRARPRATLIHVSVRPHFSASAAKKVRLSVSHALTLLCCPSTLHL